MPLSKPQPWFTKLNKQFTALRRQRPALVPIVIVTAIIVCCLLYAVMPSSQSRYQVLSMHNRETHEDPLSPLKLQIHHSRKSLTEQLEDHIDSEPVIDEDALRDAMKKALQEARKKPDSVPAAALIQLKSELDAAIAANRFERCATIRDIIKAVEQQIADNVIVTESVDDYIGRIEHSLKPDEPIPEPTIEQSSNDQSNEQSINQTEEPAAETDESSQSPNELEVLRNKINALEEEVRAKHRVRMLANRARKGNSQIKIGRLSHVEAESRAGIRSNQQSSNDDEQVVEAGIRSPDQQNDDQIKDEQDERPSRGGIYPNQHDDVGDRVGVKAGIHAGDIDGDRHHRTNGFKTYEEAKAAAEASKRQRNIYSA